MSVLINVPTPLRSITKDRTVEVDGSTSVSYTHLTLPTTPYV